MNDFEKWLASDEGKRCAEYPIKGGSEYLRNRLWWAYNAGYAKRGEIEVPQSVPNGGCSGEG